MIKSQPSNHPQEAYQINPSNLIKVGITGQAGFMGSHLYHYLGLQEGIKRIPFQDHYFEKPEKLEKFVKECDTIVHLAAMNRHPDPRVIYDTNLALVKKLIAALRATGSRAHILFSSSTQENRENLYGRSKKEGRHLLAEWAEKEEARFTGLVIPNVFGPFGRPYYNSVVATFCHQLTGNEPPEIKTDNSLKLIYINDLLEIFQKVIKTRVHEPEYRVAPTSEKKVSELLEILNGCKNQYMKRGIIPNLDDPLQRDLFNTFVCYLDLTKFYPVPLKENRDERGVFVETVKTTSGGQVSWSTTVPGITRGNHFHIRKAERFAVIRGKARIQLRRIGTKKVMDFDLDGREPSYVDMPVWHTHNLTNTGDSELLTLFWISESFDPEDPDTYFEKV